MRCPACGGRVEVVLEPRQQPWLACSACEYAVPCKVVPKEAKK